MAAPDPNPVTAPAPDRAAAATLDGPVFSGLPEGARLLAASGQDLVRRIHEAVYRQMGRSGNEAELKGVPGAESVLVDQGRMDEPALVAAYAEACGLPVVDEEEIQTVDVFPDLTYDFLSDARCLPLAWDASTVLLAVADPYRVGDLALTWATVLGRDASFVLLRRTLVERLLSEHYDNPAGDTADDLTWEDGASEETLRDLAREAPIVRLVNDMFTRAQEMGASDIHVEPAETELAIRFRIDGILRAVLTPPVAQYPAIASRIKLLAGMNIAERRLPQDGRLDIQVGASQLDVRVSSVPSMHGESIVLRLLQKDMTVFDLEKVGLSDDMRGQFEHLFGLPHGMILVVGPTGSGKTTTLYCVMRQLHSETRKIITIEDPVEYQLDGLTQIQVRPKIGLTFADGLRSIVRQDPDVILVGEIRDRETAEIAIHAALTGHLVLSTLHTNDAAGAVSRLLEMGVESFLISSALLGVVSQRLVRRVCAECGGSGESATHEGGASRRCRVCHGSGYRGRVGIFEMMLMNDELRRAVNEHRDTTELNAIARRHGMVPLREDGAAKVAAGTTTAAEVARVCQLDAV